MRQPPAAAAAAAAADPLDLACHGRAQACLGRRAARTRRTGRLVCASLAALPHLPRPTSCQLIKLRPQRVPKVVEQSAGTGRCADGRLAAQMGAHLRHLDASINLRAPIVRAVPSAQHPSAICGGDSQRNAHRRQSIYAICPGPSRPSVRLSIAQPKCACASPWPSASPLAVRAPASLPYEAWRTRSV